MGRVVRRLLLASPRGYCAGVERAVETVERALELHGPPVYVRRQIVHNLHVVGQLEAQGAIFVHSEQEAPVGAPLVLSAHGVAPSVRRGAAHRRLRTIDATCPLVAKVHAEARRYAQAGYTILLVGHAGHEEVEGTLGEAPDSTLLVQTIADAERVRVPDPSRVAYVTQTTLSVDETDQIVAALRRRFPAIEGPQAGDICYATTNRQRAVKELAVEVDLLLVIGSRNSSNSNRLVETGPGGRRRGASDRGRDRDRGAVAGGGGDGRPDLRRVGAGGARRARLRLVSRPRGRGRARGRLRRRRRRLPASGRGAPGLFRRVDARPSRSRASRRRPRSGRRASPA